MASKPIGRRPAWLGLTLFVLLAVCLAFSRSRRPPRTPPSPGAPGVQPFQYVDDTACAGITFRHDDGRQGTATMMEQAGPGCALLDYDGDGWLDLYIVNGRDLYGRHRQLRNVLYHNNRDGTFSDVTKRAGVPGTGYGLGVAVGDYDNDGHPDIYVCQYGKNVLYHNNGDGTFTDVTAQAHVDGMDYGEPFHTGATWIDYDRDGRLDLFVCGYVKFRTGPRYCRIAGASVSVRSNCPPYQYEGTYCILYHNDGNGKFTNVTKKAGLFIRGSKALTAISVDFDDDGWPDIYVGNDGLPAYLFRNNRDGTFKEVGDMAGVARTGRAMTMAAMGVDFGDYEDTGRQSLFVGDFQDVPDHLFENLGRGMFQDVTDRSGIGTPTQSFLTFGGGFLDYDNDGWLDLFVANGHVYPEVSRLGGGVHYKQHPQLFRNRRDGTFENVTARAGPAFKERWSSRGAAFGDIWNRGVVDILVANNTDRPVLMKNIGTPGRHSVSLKLIGTRSNRDGIGAKVYITCHGIRQMREVRTSNSYLSSSDVRLHFGLGATPIIDRLEVQWPLGRHDVFTRVRADQFYQLTEGQAHLDIAHAAPPDSDSRTAPKQHPAASSVS